MSSSGKRFVLKHSSTDNFNKSNIKEQDNNFDEQINFVPELKELMYGFGDKKNPDNESAELLQGYVIEYIQNLSLAAYRRSRRKGYNEIILKDLLYILKNDKKRFYRAPSLISFYETIKKTNKKIGNDKQISQIFNN